VLGRSVAGKKSHVAFRAWYARTIMARHLRSCLALLSVLALAGACKVSVSGSSSTADDAKPDSGGGAAKPDSGGGDGKAGGGDGSGDTGLSAAPAEPGQPEASDPSGNLSAGTTCADAGHAPGDSWKDDCNTCNCTDAGEVVCTRMHCGDDDSAPH
jgi:hypothetical protein